jgi:hypothetical protein
MIEVVGLEAVFSSLVFRIYLIQISDRILTILIEIICGFSQSL